MSPLMFILADLHWQSWMEDLLSDTPSESEDAWHQNGSSHDEAGQKAKTTKWKIWTMDHQITLSVHVTIIWPIKYDIPVIEWKGSVCDDIIM